MYLIQRYLYRVCIIKVERGCTHVVFKRCENSFKYCIVITGYCT